MKFTPHYSQLCAQTQVSEDLKGNGCLNWNPQSGQREEQPRPALAANSRLCLESFIQIIFKSKNLLWKCFIRWYRGRNPILCPGQVHINLIASIQMSEPNGSQFYHKDPIPRRPAVTCYRDQIDLSFDNIDISDSITIIMHHYSRILTPSHSSSQSLNRIYLGYLFPSAVKVSVLISVQLIWNALKSEERNLGLRIPSHPK